MSKPVIKVNKPKRMYKKKKPMNKKPIKVIDIKTIPKRQSIRQKAISKRKRVYKKRKPKNN